MLVSQIVPNRCLGLDLLRAVAVVMVLLSHWTSHFGYWFKVAVPAAVDVMGDVGVEIFFALSGFLIGRILIGIAAAKPTWSDFRIFMIRRAMRTLPLYFLWLLLLLSLFPPHQDAVATAWRFVTLSQNLISDMPADYYFIVTWSLTVEEWFYLTFGGLLIFLSRYAGGSRALPWCLAVFLLMPLSLRLAFMQRTPLVVFRIDEIAYGVLMASLYVRHSAVFRRPWTTLAAGVTLIGACIMGLLPLPGNLAVPLTSNFEVIGGALCLPAALRLYHAPSWLEAMIRWIAGRSYALYLIHLTILVDVVERLLFERGLLPASGCVIIAVAMPCFLAELSYRFVEAPLLCRRPRQQLGDKAATGAAVVSGGAVVYGAG